MNILVNNESIELDLKKMETLGDILQEISERAFVENKTISEVKLDGRPIRVEEEKSLRVEEINTLELEVIRYVDLVIDSLNELKDYLPKLTSAISKIEGLLKEDKQMEVRNLLKDFIIGMKWVIDITAQFVKIFPEDSSPNFKQKQIDLERFKHQIDIEDLSLSSKILVEHLNPLLKDMFFSLPKLIEDIESQGYEDIDSETLLNNLNNTLEQLRDMIEEIEGLSVNLQSGEEGDAMQSLQNVSFRLEAMMELLQKTKRFFRLDYSKIYFEDESVEGKILDVKDLLGEIIIALENKDWEGLSDLLEYKLNPLLSSFQEIIKIIISQIRVN